MRILGVDPGLTRCGLGVIDARASRKVKLIDVGVIGTTSDTPVELRLLAIADGIDEWITRLEPECISVERVFAQQNVASVMGTAQVAGIAMLAAGRRGLPVALHTPTEVKAAVTGSGRAGKAQVQQMVARILGLAEIPKPADAADALALAICHAWQGGSASAGPTGAPARGGASPGTPAQRAWAEAERAARSRG